MKRLLLLPLVISLALSSCKQEEKQKAHQDKNTDQAQLATQTNSETGLIVRDESLDLSGVSDVLENAKQSADAGEKTVILLVERYLKRCQAISQKLDKSAHLIIEASDPSTTKTLENIEKKLSQISAYEKVNKEVRKNFVDDMIPFLHQQAKDLKIPKTNREEFFGSFFPHYEVQLGYIKTIRDTDAELCENSRQQLLLMKENYGKWVWNSTRKTIEFESKETIESYSNLIKKNIEISERQAAAQRRLLSSM